MVTLSATVPDQVESSFKTWQQSLVELKRAENPSSTLITKQQELIGSTKSTASLAAYLSDRLNITSELIAAVPPLQPVTADEMLQTPVEWELHIGSQLGHVEPQRARSSPWWYICHIAWLQAGVFPDPPDIAFKARINAQILTRTPATMPKDECKELDIATRNLLRRLGGLPHIRRLYRIATDPPISRAYWRHRLASEAARCAPAVAKLTIESCHQILYNSSWDKFIERSQLTYSSILAPRALAAVCAASTNEQKRFNETHLQAVARRALQAHPQLIDWNYLSCGTAS